MKLAKIALVALALWIPAASFAAAAVQRQEASCPAQEQAPDEAAGESELDVKELALPCGVRAGAACAETHFLDYEPHRRVQGLYAEPLLPPPNPAAR